MSVFCAVWMVTYNQERYISQAIESIINQKTTFPIKLFIGEDCSTDKTREICLQYKQDYPELIDLIFTKKNDIIQNAQNTYSACFNSGAKYIAMCEGDDYWTDLLKLQKQVDFLEANPDYAFCYHHVNVVQEGNISNTKMQMRQNQPDTSSIAEILKKSVWPHINSVVFCNQEKLKKMPSWVLKCPSGDWAFLAFITGTKKIKYINETMSVYRQQGGGTWNSTSRNKNFIKTLKTARDLNKYLVEPSEKEYIYWPIHYAFIEQIAFYKYKNPFKAFYFFISSILLDFKFNYIFNKNKDTN
jgi:glycosyltransferase involved in cell wall biosynthesis